MIAASFEVTLVLQGPILTQSTTQGHYGVDAVMAQSDGRYYLPGTLIKGLVGEAWQELSVADKTYDTARKRWLGERSETQNLPIRGRLFFEDLVDNKTTVEGGRTQYRIEIDSERGSAKHGQLLVIEAPYRSGEQVQFQGTVRVLAEEHREAEEARNRVQTALRWVGSVGAERSIGFGRVVKAECGTISETHWTDRPTSIDAAFELKLKFKHPVCFARRRIGNNLFESERWISGAALKGSLATMLAADKDRWPHLREHLSAVRFTHAFPSNDGQERPKYPPESIIEVGERAYEDAILVKDAELRYNAAPRFSVDWKNSAEVWAAFGWPEKKQELRVRTAICGESKRAAEGELFAYQMMVPGGIEWRGRVFMAGVDESVRPMVAKELGQAIENGLFALGKTKAHASVTSRPYSLPTAGFRGDQIAIALQTSALLCDPRRHIAREGQIGATDRDLMWEEYQEVWRELSSESLELQNYFHRQSLGGGEYLRHRFQSDKPYRPYLLTEAGSIFLLRVERPERARECVTRWLQRGLPLSAPVQEFYLLNGVPEDKMWEVCPFLPENGFGEISVTEPVKAWETIEVGDV